MAGEQSNWRPGWATTMPWEKLGGGGNDPTGQAESNAANIARFNAGLGALNQGRAEGFGMFQGMSASIDRTATMQGADAMQSMMRRGLGSSTVLSSIKSRFTEAAGRAKVALAAQKANFAYSSAGGIANYMAQMNDRPQDINKIADEVERRNRANGATTGTGQITPTRQGGGAAGTPASPSTTTQEVTAPAARKLPDADKVRLMDGLDFSTQQQVSSLISEYEDGKIELAEMMQQINSLVQQAGKGQ